MQQPLFLQKYLNDKITNSYFYNFLLLLQKQTIHIHSHLDVAVHCTVHLVRYQVAAVMAAAAAVVAVAAIQCHHQLVLV